MTQLIGAAVLTLQLAIAITLVLVVDLIAHMKDIRELVVVAVVIIVREIHKTRVILQAHVVEQPVPMVNRTAALTVINVLIATALQAILTIAGAIVTAIADVAAAGAVAITVVLVVVVLLAVQAAVVVVVQVVVHLRREVPAKATSCQV